MRKAGDALYPRSGVLPSFEYEPWGDTGALCTVEGDRALWGTLEQCAGRQVCPRRPFPGIRTGYRTLSFAWPHTPPPLVPLVIYHTNIRPATTHCVPVGLVPLIIQPRDDPFLLQLHETLMSGGWGGSINLSGGR